MTAGRPYTGLLLLLINIISIIVSQSTATPLDDAEQPQHSRLQRRATVCNPGPSQNLDLFECLLAASNMPDSREAISFNFRAHMAHAFHLPRIFCYRSCIISVDFMPGRAIGQASWFLLKEKAKELIRTCVGSEGPGQSDLPRGRGGIYVYQRTLRITLERRGWMAHSGGVELPSSKIMALQQDTCAQNEAVPTVG